jgi:hypothetical protein
MSDDHVEFSSESESEADYDLSRDYVSGLKLKPLSGEATQILDMPSRMQSFGSPQHAGLS